MHEAFATAVYLEYGALVGLPIACFIQKQRTEVRGEVCVCEWRDAYLKRLTFWETSRVLSIDRETKKVSQNKIETRRRRVFTFLHGISGRSGLSVLSGLDGLSAC
jgi:hypothetical protein